MASVTRNGNVVTISGATAGTGPYIIETIFAGTTNALQQVRSGSTSTFWTPNAAGDQISFDKGYMVDGIACTAAGDSFQVFLR